MRIFVAGATGVIGQRLVPALVAAGHEVTGTTRSPARAAELQTAGATAVIVDGLDRRAVTDAVKAAQPDVIVHQMTALASMRSFRNFDSEFAVTNELRVKGTDNLLEAARQAGTRRFIAQSFIGWNNARTGSLVKTEEDPLDPDPVPSTRRSMAAIRHVEDTVPGAVPEGLVLRYGFFYGHGASDSMLGTVRKRQMPVVGGGAGIWSFTDAATATAAAVTRGAAGLYNIVDDDPAPVREWLPYLAQCLGAKPPMRVPAWLGRVLAGQLVVSLMTQARGSVNEKAKQELGWAPRYASWREGFPVWVSEAQAA
jgi:nucleoside-diphosphate-sugar epimerase